MRRKSEIQADLDRVMGDRNRYRSILEDLAVIYPAIKHTRPNPETVTTVNGYVTNWWASSDYPWRAEDIARLAAAIKSESSKAEVEKLRKEFRG